MHPAAKFQFERVVREFAQWRAVPADERSPAPAWWWQPAFEVVAQQEEMPPLCSIRLQTSLPWPDEFPRKIQRAEKPEAD